MKKIFCIMVTLIFAICSFVIFVSASASTAEKIEVGTNLRNCTITISATEASTAQADLTRVFVLDSGDKIYFSDHSGSGATTYHYYGDGIFGDGNISWVCSFTDLVYTFPDDKDYIVTTLNSTYISGTYVSNTPKTTFDLSTLGLAAGEHIITVKAKADGYLTSAASASLAYTVEENATEFTISGTTYYFTEGMTWGEWLESEYNTDGYYQSSTTGYIIKDDSGSHILTVENNYMSVGIDDVISTEYTYQYSTHSGGSA